VGKTVGLIPHKTVQIKLLSPSTELLNANAFLPSHLRTDLSPYHDVLGIHYTGRDYLGGAGTVEVRKAERSGGHVGIEVALYPTKEERVLWVSC